MQTACLALLAALSLPLACAGNPDLVFREPAQLGPEVSASTVAWAILLFEGGTEGSLGLQADAGTVMVNHTRDLPPVVHHPHGTVPMVTTVDTDRNQTLAAVDAALGFRPQDVGSLYVEGVDLRIETAASHGALQRQPGGCINGLLAFQEEQAQLARSGKLCPPAPAVAVVFTPDKAATFGVRIAAANITRLEWHGAQVDCRSQECVDGGERRVEWTNMTGGFSVEDRSYAYIELQGAPMRLAGEARVTKAILGSSSLDLAVAGWLRLPLASAQSSCPDCTAPTNQTLWATGDLLLDDVRLGEIGTFTATFGGMVSTVRLDETSIDPAALLGLGAAAGAAAAAFGVTVLVKLLAPLFTRVQRGRALENPRRQALRDYIEKHPGAPFRELLRAFGYSAASTRFHLDVLKQTGHIRELRHRNSKRFLPAAMQVPERQMQAILLRDPKLADLHGLVKRNPWLSQGDCMDLAARELGWSRGTAQHRLVRLVEGGLVQTRKKGRFLLHAVREEPWAFRPLKSEPPEPHLAIPAA